MTETPQALAEKLRIEGARLADFFSGLNAAEWDSPVYAEGSIWTIRSILSHLVTAERAFVKLFESVRQGGPGVSEDFSIDRYNARQQEKTAEMTPADLLQAYRAIRAELVGWVAGLDENDLQKTGRHPYLGPTSLLEMIKMVYVHNQVHYRDVRRTLN
jgi:uncharacterized protein (TIGR03083 family)